MLGQFVDWLQISLSLFDRSTTRIIWNLFLAFIPLIFSLYLFRPQAVRNLFWWVSLFIFSVFLPNAPYVLTDSIHIIELSRQNYPAWAIIIIVVPQYALFILLGFEAYIVSLSRIEQYLNSSANPQYSIAIKAIAHGLSVVGIYIGRFERFNSWDLLTKPGTVIITTTEDLLDLEKLLCMAIAFVTIWLLSELVERVNRKIYVRTKTIYS